MIQVEALTKFYDEFCAVDQVAFNVQKGEIVGLLGPNGAGKTTTLRMLTGFFKPTAGTITIKEMPISQNLLEIKQLMGYLPELAPLYQDMLVYDYLVFVAEIRGITGPSQLDRLKELSRTCGLQGILHKPVRALSKGLKQRVGLAHAMMDDPEILILDEPTSGLDPNQIIEIREIIRRIGEQKTVILSTHILSEAEATCDRIIIIDKGRIVADGSTEQLKQSMGHEATLKVSLVSAELPAVQKALESIEGVVDIKASEKNTKDQLDLQIVCKNGSDLRIPIYEAIKQQPWGLIEMVLETQSLEGVFRELTKES